MSYQDPREFSAGVLRAEMARQRRTARDLAEILQISRSSAQRRLDGVTGLDLNETQTICAWLGIDPLEFFPRPITSSN